MGMSEPDSDNIELIGLMGGTFDPIHCGHLRMALECYQRVGLKKVFMIPCGNPGHRNPPQASAEQRLAMTQLAVGDSGELDVDDREVRRQGITYTIDTLVDLRQKKTTQQRHCLILGADAVASLPAWRDWRKILELCHIIVVQRPGYSLEGEDPPLDWMKDHRVSSIQALKKNAAGAIYSVNAPILEVSATYVRSLVAKGHSAQYLVPSSVYQFIKDNQLYQG